MKCPSIVLKKEVNTVIATKKEELLNFTQLYQETRRITGEVAYVKVGFETKASASFQTTTISCSVELPVEAKESEILTGSEYALKLAKTLVDNQAELLNSYNKKMIDNKRRIENQ